MKSFEYCCREVADKHGYIFEGGFFTPLTPCDHKIPELYKEAAEMYAKEVAIHFHHKRVTLPINQFPIGTLQLEIYNDLYDQFRKEKGV